MIGFISGCVLGVIVGAVAAWQFGLNEAQADCILDLLTRSPEPMFGLDLVEQSGGLLKRGTVYVLLGRMEDRGLIASAMSIEGRRRYALPPAPDRRVRKGE